MIERTPQEEILEGFFMLGLVLPRVAVIAATLPFLPAELQFTCVVHGDVH